VILKAALLLVVLLGLMVAVYNSPLRRALDNVQDTAREIRAMGAWAPAVFTLGVAALVAAGVPRLLFCPIAGLAFGFWQGLLWSQSGTLLGYYGMFLFVRWGGRGIVERLHPRLHELAGKVRRQGIAAVFLARQLPMHGMLVNWLISITPVRHRDFLVGTAIGLIPEAIPCTLIGSGMLHGTLWAASRTVVVAAVLLALAWIGLAVYGRKALSRESRTEATPENGRSSGSVHE
jgi:uncharacterized membrane protein YdjX (TVP38/TMEM64 family)